MRFADKAPFPPPESLYDDIYVLGDQVKGWYSVDERSAGVHKGEDERSLASSAEQQYEKAVEQSQQEDVEGEEKDADEAQEDED